ncbi:ParB/RepB/Spo0J family partition protein [uncultured Hyphomonas sp.]|uniref:ParB/RepB/Spo0J family partition protein n=1 Tax=uncultured Hyphomonas sp. TaxID=225298 RepID=UPI0026C272AC|tara:strand:+ start:4011 stop:6041 length:2031 start_codon:yes stop_codon:yes gene_type:complete
MRSKPDIFERVLGPRPVLTLYIADLFVREIWVEGRAPIIRIRDYDWGETDTEPAFDSEGFPYTPINWRGPAWRLGLSLHPPAKETYTMANQTLKTIPLEDLKVSKLNMRHGRKKPDISDILPSIRQHGVRQTLLVRREGKHYGVVAGRRRLFALKQVAKETGICPKVPCVVMQGDDDAAAIEASILENAARLPATEMEQYVAFGRLADEGRSAIEIADYFGVTELTVKRVLALASLSEPIRSLYAADEIDRNTIRALTLATPEQQADWLALFESKDERAPRGRQCRAWITGGDTIRVDKALFDLDSYDGEIIADLFGEGAVFADIDAFWQAQSAAIAAEIETYTAKGWRDVQILDRGRYFHKWDHQTRAKTKGGKVFIEVRHDGSVTFHEGFVTEAEARKLDKATNGVDGVPAAVKPEMNGPMATYVLRHRHAAVRADLLAHTGVALRLMVANVLVGSALWTVRAHQKRVAKEVTAESLAASRGERNLSAAETKVGALFKALGLSGLPRANGDPYHLCEVFSAMLALSDDEVMQVMAYAMADTLEAGGPMVEALLHVLGTDLPAYWQPDAAFFDLLRDKRAINAMVAEIASPTIAEGCLTETGKVQKSIIAGRIAGDGCEADPDWRPRWMQVPPAAYVEGAGSAPAEAWGRIGALFAETAPDDAQRESVPSKPVAA